MNNIKIYVIGSKEHEPDRIEYLDKYFTSKNIYATYYQPWYKTNLTSEILQKYVPVNQSLHNRPLRMSEISLFLNYIYLFQKILNEHTDGLFLILESDVIFTGDLSNYLSTLTNIINTSDYDCISIGAGCNLRIPGIDYDSDAFYFMKIRKTRATDSMLYTYNGIKKFMNYLDLFLKEGKSLNQPIDNFLDTYFNIDISFNFLWVHPTICVQGSEHAVYKSNIQIPDEL